MVNATPVSGVEFGLLMVTLRVDEPAVGMGFVENVSEMMGGASTANVAELLGAPAPVHWSALTPPAVFV